MIRPIPRQVSRVLREGDFCYLAAITPDGPHLTPVVFAVHDAALWVTTSRRSVKARAWKKDRRVGGLVRGERGAISFLGTVRTYDVLDPETWARAVLRAPQLTRAAASFTAKNARFFAGYAVDAYRIPLAWTPPGRVFAEIRLDRAALLDGNDRPATWGRFGSTFASHDTFRAARAGKDPLRDVPEDVRARVGDGGAATLAVEGRRGPLVVPAAWTAEGGIHAVVSASELRLSGSGPDVRCALTVDHASRWRARAMAGILVQGDGKLYEVERLRSGGRSAAEVAERAGFDPDGAVVVRIRPRRVVWWRGWDSGSRTIGKGNTVTSG